MTTSSADGGGNFDVLVIGCGPAGASAAIAAHDAGARVLVLEKRASGGGNALVAGGFLRLHVRGRRADACFGLDHPPAVESIARSLG